MFNREKWYVPLTIGMTIGPFRSEKAAWNFIDGRGLNAIDPARRYLARGTKPYKES